MIANSTSAELRTMLTKISWQTFETLLKEIGDRLLCQSA
jgi:hypothetical protein